MPTREQRREIQEKAWGTYERNSTIRFCVSAGLLKPIQLARAFKMTKQRVNGILHPGKIGQADKYQIPDWCKMPLAYHNDGMGGCWGISYGYTAREGENYCKTCEYYRPVEEK